MGNMKTRAGRLKILQSHVLVAFKRPQILHLIKSQNNAWPLINSPPTKAAPLLANTCMKRLVAYPDTMTLC